MNEYSYVGEAMHWDYLHDSTSSWSGYQLPMQGGSASQFTRIRAGDQGQTVDGNFFTDEDPTNLIFKWEIHWTPPTEDLYPAYTGYGGQKRNVYITMEWDYTGSPNPQVWTLARSGGSGFPRYWTSTFYADTFIRVYWPGKLGRFTPCYYDNGISGTRARIQHIRLWWYHIGR